MKLSSLVNKKEQSTAATVLLWMQKHPQLMVKTTPKTIASQMTILNPSVKEEDALEAITWMKKDGILNWTSRGPQSTYEINYDHKFVERFIVKKPKKQKEVEEVKKIEVEQPELKTPHKITVQAEDQKNKDIKISITLDITVKSDGSVEVCKQEK